MNDWHQLLVEPDPESLAAVEQWLDEAGALAFTLQDAGDEPLLEPPPGATPLWQHTRLIALFAGDADMPAVAGALADAFPASALGQISMETLADRVWELEWRRDFRPMRFGNRLWVAPADAIDQLPADAVTVLMAPGLAFGTGTHPTTALCLKWLDAQPLAGRSLLDYGCGSGILAIAAAHLGADVTATDIDPQALSACTDNAAANGFAALPVYAIEALPEATWDVIVANILAGTLSHLAPQLAARTRAGGDLVLSGLLDHQAESLMAAYREWFEFLPPARLGEWCLLHGIRRPERGLALARSMLR